MKAKYRWYEIAVGIPPSIPMDMFDGVSWHNLNGTAGGSWDTEDDALGQLNAMCEILRSHIITPLTLIKIYE